MWLYHRKIASWLIEQRRSERPQLYHQEPQIKNSGSSLVHGLELLPNHHHLDVGYCDHRNNRVIPGLPFHHPKTQGQIFSNRITQVLEIGALLVEIHDTLQKNVLRIANRNKDKTQTKARARNPQSKSSKGGSISPHLLTFLKGHRS
jgi:hypothetical protein